MGDSAELVGHSDRVSYGVVGRGRGVVRRVRASCLSVERVVSVRGSAIQCVGRRDRVAGTVVGSRRGLSERIRGLRLAIECVIVVIRGMAQRIGRARDVSVRVIDCARGTSKRIDRLRLPVVSIIGIGRRVTEGSVTLVMLPLASYAVDDVWFSASTTAVWRLSTSYWYCRGMTERVGHADDVAVGIVGCGGVGSRDRHLI